jgi:hypothetical protein
MLLQTSYQLLFTSTGIRRRWSSSCVVNVATSTTANPTVNVGTAANLTIAASPTPQKHHNTPQHTTMQYTCDSEFHVFEKAGKVV